MGFWCYSSYVCYTYCSNTTLLYTILSEGCSEMSTYGDYIHDLRAKKQEQFANARSNSEKTKSSVKFVDLATETDEFVKSQEKARKNVEKPPRDVEIGTCRGYNGLIPPPKFYAGGQVPALKRIRSDGGPSHLSETKKPETATPNPNSAFRRKKHGERGSTADFKVTYGGQIKKADEIEHFPAPTAEVLDDLLDKVHEKQKKTTEAIFAKAKMTMRWNALKGEWEEIPKEEGNTPWPEDETEWDEPD